MSKSLRRPPLPPSCLLRVLATGLSRPQAYLNKPSESPTGIRTRGHPLRLPEALARSAARTDSAIQLKHLERASDAHGCARDSRKFTCVRSNEHTAWHNASNFHAKHASVLRSQPVTCLKGSVVPTGTPLQLDVLRSCAEARLKWSSHTRRIKQTIMCHYVCSAAKLRTLEEISMK